MQNNKFQKSILSKLLMRYLIRLYSSKTNKIKEFKLKKEEESKRRNG
jgi:hypothetical protein